MVKHIINVSEFWSNVTKELDLRKWSYASFADKLGVSRQSIIGARYHRSPLSISTVIQISYVLNVRPSLLLGFFDDNLKYLSDNERVQTLVEYLQINVDEAIRALYKSLDPFHQTLCLVKAKQLIGVKKNVYNVNGNE